MRRCDNVAQWDWNGGCVRSLECGRSRGMEWSWLLHGDCEDWTGCRKGKVGRFVGQERMRVGVGKNMLELHLCMKEPPSVLMLSRNLGARVAGEYMLEERPC